MKAVIIEKRNEQNNHQIKVVATDDGSYRMVYDYKTGLTIRFGKTQDDDPAFAPMGPEILDFEISTICNGLNGVPCTHCYKSNTGNGKNTSFEMFKEVFHRMPRTLTQIAFGIGDIEGNPDLRKIFNYCRNNSKNGKVIPNVTVNGAGLTKDWAKYLANTCGSIAVSRYTPPEICYEAVQKLVKAGGKQINVHCLVSHENLPACYELVKDFQDKKLAGLNAIVFMLLKPKGRGNSMTSASFEDYKKFVNFAIDKVPMGCDSCSAPQFMLALKDHPELKRLLTLIEPCESGLFSSYINTEGVFFPCSFTEGTKGWETGLAVHNCNDFLTDIWYNSRTIEWRKQLLESSSSCNCSLKALCRSCPGYDISRCKYEDQSEVCEQQLEQCVCDRGECKEHHTESSVLDGSFAGDG